MNTEQKSRLFTNWKKYDDIRFRLYNLNRDLIAEVRQYRYDGLVYWETLFGYSPVSDIHGGWGRINTADTIQLAKSDCIKCLEGLGYRLIDQKIINLL